MSMDMTISSRKFIVPKRELEQMSQILILSISHTLRFL
jgi:hypothetical protein